MRYRDKVLIEKFISRRLPQFVWANNGAMESRYASALIIEAINALRNNLYWSASMAIVIAIDCNIRLILAEADVGKSRERLKQIRKVASFGKIKKEFVGCIQISSEESFCVGKINVTSENQKNKLIELLNLFVDLRDELLAHIDLTKGLENSKLASSLREVVNKKSINGEYISTDKMYRERLNIKSMQDYENFIFKNLVFSADDLFIEQYNKIAHDLLSGIIELDKILELHNKFILEKQIELSNQAIRKSNTSSNS